eukprot:10561582-Prorocentrum_lima.AAC.1
MTSSLVGSEMCIRDRTRRSSMPIRASNAFERVPRWWLRAVVTGWGLPRCCLLYTSDAADDM